MYIHGSGLDILGFNPAGEGMSIYLSGDLPENEDSDEQDVITCEVITPESLTNPIKYDGSDPETHISTERVDSLPYSEQQSLEAIMVQAKLITSLVTE